MPPSAFRRWAGLLVLGGAGFLGFFTFQLLGLLIDPVKRDLGLSDTQLGLLNGFGIAVFFACAALPIGWLADRFDRRFVLGGCLLVWSAATAACGLAHSFTGYAAGVIAIAVGESAMIPIVYAMIPPLFAEERERSTANAIVYAILASSAGLGLMLGGAALGWIDTLHRSGILSAMAPWRQLFVATGLLGLPMMALLAFIPQPASPVTPRDAIADRAAFGRYLRENGVTVVIVYLATALYSVGWSTLYLWTPAILGRTLGYSEARAGTDAGLVVLIATACGVALAWRSMRVTLPKLGPGGPLALARYGCWLALPAMIGLAFAPGPVSFLVLLGVVATGLFFATAIAPMILQDIAPNALSSRVIALYPLVLMMPRAIAPSMVGLLSDLRGAMPRSLLEAVSIVCTLTLPASIALLRWVQPRFGAVADENRKSSRNLRT